MSEKKSNGSRFRSLTVDESIQHDDHQDKLSRSSSVTSLNQSKRISKENSPRSDEIPSGNVPSSSGFNLLQSIKDLTHQELNRANPLGLLGKEVIYATGTTHCPEPIPPNENDPMSTSTMETSEHQQIHFPLNEEEKLHMQRRRSTLVNLNETVLPPCPGEFISDPNESDCQPHLFSSFSPNTMLADFIPETMAINVFEVFIYAWGVFAFFFDMITDLVLAHAYYLEGAYWLFILTLMCVILPNVTLSLFSLVWYIDSNQLKASTNHQNNENDQIDGHISRPRHSPSKPSTKERKLAFHLSSTSANIFTWILRILILVLQLDLCLKYIRGLYYTWKGFQKRHDPKWKRFYLTKQILIDADIALLRVFDCFMDSGSQVILQLYIMLRLGSASMKFDNLFAKQCLSIISSLASLAYALSGYSRCWRHMQLTHSPQGWPQGKPAPQLVSWWSTIIQWFWYLFLITPRVFALAMFAATFRSWFWIILVAHWFGMLFWILRFRTIFCISDTTKYNPREAIFEKCYNLVCSYIFIFCYMNLRKGDTRQHYIAFYTIYYIENISFSIIYAIHSAETNSILKYSLVTFVCAGFWFAILFQFVYYRFLHPSDHVRVNTKENLASFSHLRPLSNLNRLKKSKSCEQMLNQQDPTADLSEVISLQLNQNSNNERWYNRFSKENRQKLISQQQAIDYNVKLTRAQKQSGRFDRSSENSFSKLTNPSIISSSTPKTSDVSRTRSIHQETYKKMSCIEEDPLQTSQESGTEMILSATTLTPRIIGETSKCNRTDFLVTN